MARDRGPKCRLCRREGIKLFLKGDRCHSAKCAIDRRGYAPGEHGEKQRRKLSEYGRQLREKQKVRRIYGVHETQFRNYYEEATRQKGVTGENLMRLLERRLDNVVFRLGFAASRTAGRQLVRHRHFSVNGRPVDVPSYLLRGGDVVAVRDRSRGLAYFKTVKENPSDRNICDWLSRDNDKMSGTLKEIPSRDAIPAPVEEQLIVELYSK
jgi:small subunit ribosomal protein S4